MKGVFADSQTIFGEALLNYILPSNTYGHVSGGLPEKIPGFSSFYYCILVRLRKQVFFIYFQKSFRLMTS